MKSFVAAFVLGLLAVSPLGCQAGGPMARSRERANEQAIVIAAAPVAKAETRDTSNEPRGFALGAGDALGQRVFSTAVAAARDTEAQSGRRFASLHEAADWQLAHADTKKDEAVQDQPTVVVAQASGDRAIFPAFVGNESHEANRVDLRERWANVTVLRAERRPWLIDGRGFFEPIETIGPAQWPVAAVLIPD